MLPAILIFLLAASPVLASVIDDAKYHGTIRVTNASEDADSYVSTNFTHDSERFIANRYASENLTDVAIKHNGIDTAFMPGVDGNPWIMFVPEIDAGQNVDYDLYSGNVTDGLICYFPDDAGMSCNDSETMELGDNFTIEQTGWFDTSWEADADSWLWADDVSGTSWSNPLNAADNSTATYAAYTLTANIFSDFLTFTFDAPISASKVKYWITFTSTDTRIVDIDVSSNGTWIDVFEGAAVTGDWVEKNLPSTCLVDAIRIRTKSDGNEDSRIHEVQMYGYANSKILVRKPASYLTYISASNNITVETCLLYTSPSPRD